MAENTKFQANFKLADGTLVNVYADSAEEFEAQLAAVQDTAALIHSVSQSLTSAGPAAPFQRRQYPGKGAAPAAPIHPLDDRLNTPAPMPAPASPDGPPQCAHGTMQMRSGTSAKGPWRGWMCAAPKGVAPKCETIWIR